MSFGCEGLSIFVDLEYECLITKYVSMITCEFWLICWKLDLYLASILIVKPSYYNRGLKEKTYVIWVLIIIKNDLEFVYFWVKPLLKTKFSDLLGFAI